ncbi:ATP-dependent DNA helicase PIF1-like protein [Tanacetum coccineum]
MDYQSEIISDYMILEVEDQIPDDLDVTNMLSSLTLSPALKPDSVIFQAIPKIHPAVVLFITLRTTLVVQMQSNPRRVCLDGRERKQTLVLGDFLLRVGNGDEELVDENYIRIPDDMTIPYNDMARSKEELINAIFPSLQVNGNSSDYIISREILSTKNEHVDELNEKLIDRFRGDEKIYYSFDAAQDDKNNLYPMEFLNSLNVSGLPPHVLRLKIRCPIILLRNLDPSDGLCNGTRLICRKFEPNLIDAEIAVGQHAGKRVF